MKPNTSSFRSTLRSVCAVSVAALVAASVINAVPAPTFAAESAHAVSSEVERRIGVIAPSLVTVSVTRPGNDGRGLSIVPDNDLLGEFFKRFGDGNSLPDLPFGQNGRKAATETVTGTGFVIGGDGLIATAEELTASADRINVTMQGGEQVAAELVGQDRVTGLAILRVDISDALPELEWSDEALALGQPVYSIGRSTEHGMLLSSGLVASSASGGRILLDDEASPVLLGAPIVDEDGRVLAIRTRMTDPSTGMVVAVSADIAREVIAELADKGTVARGYLGVSIQPVTPDLASALGLERVYGAIVADVRAGMPAEAVGLKPGDVILSLDDETIETPADLSRAVGARDPGDDVQLTVLRDGDEIGVEVTLAALPGSKTSPEAVGGTSVPELGVSLQMLTPGLREAFGLSDDVSGLVVTEVDASAGDQLQAGDVIVSAFRDPVETVEDITAAVEEARSEGRSSILVLVDRDSARIFVPVPLAAS